MAIKKSHIAISIALLSLVLAACMPSVPTEDIADPGVASETRVEATPQAPPRPSEGGVSGDAPAAEPVPVAVTTSNVSYAIVDTGQMLCYDNNSAIACPSEGATFYGQDAQYAGNQPSYTLSADGLTVYDNVTGLTWTQSPDLNGDGKIDIDDKLTFAEAQLYADTVLNPQNFGGYSDWRLPSIKELYSLMDFGGTDPNVMSTDTSGLTPFIDTGTFDFGYGDISAGERIIDAQFWSSNVYVGTVFNGQQATFGLNLADGRIKGYPSGASGRMGKLNYVYFVRGNTEYGVNDFSDNRDGTITDNATGLVWSQNDSGTGMNWEDALAWVQQKNAENYLGYNDWRLPNAKDLQSIVDYSRSPDTTGSAAIGPIFNASQITNEAGQADYPFYWTSTTHIRFGGNGGAGVYISFGRGLGSMDGTNVIDVHGAGCQRSDSKDGDPSNYPSWGHGPQGDMQRVFNYVRLVRGGAQSGVVAADAGGLPVRSGQPASEEGLPPEGGPSPAGEGPGGSPPSGGSPPAEAIQACNGLNEQSTCQFTTPRGAITGTCLPVEAQLACVPEGGPPGGPPPGD